jgi:hypothetical protein
MGKTKDIRAAVEAELSFDPLIDSADITVRNLNGRWRSTVPCRATRSTWRQHDAVVGAAWMANGVLEVRDDLSITG